MGNVSSEDENHKDSSKKGKTEVVTSRTLNILIVSVILLAGLALFFSNPSEENFKKWLNQRMDEIEADENLGYIEKTASKAVALQAELTASYNSYFLFSTVDAKFGREDYTYLGIAGTWIILSEPVSK